jgi:hypothetical protein
MEGSEVLNQFRGSEFLYEHKMVTGSKLNLTEGCHFVCETFASYWLFDLIGSHQDKLKNEHFQVWKLAKYKDEALITCEDGDGKWLESQEIPYTDFPFDISIWLVEGTCLLPSEY